MAMAVIPCQFSHYRFYKGLMDMLWRFKAPLFCSTSGRKRNRLISKSREGNFSFTSDDFIYIFIFKSRKTPISYAVNSRFK